MNNKDPDVYNYSAVCHEVFNKIDEDYNVMIVFDPHTNSIPSESDIFSLEGMSLWWLTKKYTASKRVIHINLFTKDNINKDVGYIIFYVYRPEGTNQYKLYIDFVKSKVPGVGKLLLHAVTCIADNLGVMVEFEAVPGVNQNLTRNYMNLFKYYNRLGFKRFGNMNTRQKQNPKQKYLTVPSNVLYKIPLPEEEENNNFWGQGGRSSRRKTRKIVR